MGDAGGIGPEIISKIFMAGTYKKFCNILVIGNKKLFDHTVEKYNFNFHTKTIEVPEEIYNLKDNTLGIIDVGGVVSNFELGKPSKEVGEIALKSIDKAIQLAINKSIDGIVTAPVNKEVIALSYKNFIGHTEYIAQKINATNFNMMMVSNKMKVVLVTTHLAIKDITKNITKEKVIQTIRNSRDILQKLGYKKYRIAVLALNPHAGDGGLFGNEEEKIIKPAINQAIDEGIYVEGPFVPDTFFHEYNKIPIYDIIIAMYHDQGLIPFKMESFNTGINVTIGLPIIRTSVDHGTAYQIAGKGKANPRSLFEALKFAVMLSNDNVEN